MGGRGKRSESDQSTPAIKAYCRLLLIGACTAPTRGNLSRRKSAAGWARKHAEQAHIIAVLRDKRTRTLPSGMLYGRWAWKPHEDTVLSGWSQKHCPPFQETCVSTRSGGQDNDQHAGRTTHRTLTYALTDAALQPCCSPPAQR